jgi:hypothetical protein
MPVELLSRGHSVELEYAMKVKYKGRLVGNFAVDLLVEKKLLLN